MMELLSHTRKDSGSMRNNSYTGAYCNNEYTTNIDTIATYGRLYNWYAVNTEKLAPEGWHVPTNREWKILILFAGSYPAYKLKESGNTHWLRQGSESSNETGFTALPGGGCYGLSSEPFSEVGGSGIWWSVSEYNSILAWDFQTYSDSHSLDSVPNGKVDYFSVRCIKN